MSRKVVTTEWYNKAKQAIENYDNLAEEKVIIEKRHKQLEKVTDLLLELLPESELDYVFDKIKDLERYHDF